MTGVLAEARFYGIEGAIRILTTMVEKEELLKDGLTSLTRKDVLKAIMSTPTNAELRFQGVDFVGADLSKLDLRNINFKVHMCALRMIKYSIHGENDANRRESHSHLYVFLLQYAIMHHCSLVGANLSGCCFERADLSHANLQGAQLVCVKMLCANLAAANLHSCNFEDPGGLSANMEGVNLKGANLEGSNMAAVNLRVATLKNANLRNCDLRSAVLAGADLEVPVTLCYFAKPSD